MSDPASDRPCPRRRIRRRGRRRGNGGYRARPLDWPDQRVPRRCTPTTHWARVPRSMRRSPQRLRQAAEAGGACGMRGAAPPQPSRGGADRQRRDDRSSRCSGRHGARAGRDGYKGSRAHRGVRGRAARVRDRAVVRRAAATSYLLGWFTTAIAGGGRARAAARSTTVTTNATASACAGERPTACRDDARVPCPSLRAGVLPTDLTIVVEGGEVLCARHILHRTGRCPEHAIERRPPLPMAINSDGVAPHFDHTLAERIDARDCPARVSSAASLRLGFVKSMVSSAIDSS